MKNYMLLFFSLFVFLSCDFDSSDEVLKEPNNVVPYNDTSIYIKDYSNISDVIVKIGDHEFHTPRYHVFPKIQELHPFLNWPTVTYTNKETVLVVCSNSQYYGGAGEMDVVLARKEKESNKWEIKRLFKTDSKKGLSMCPALLIDRATGRIYLFANHVMNYNDLPVKYSYNEVDQVYKYSDDDGITWSEEYSLKHRWRTIYDQSSGDFSLFGNAQSSKIDVNKSLWDSEFGGFSKGYPIKENYVYLNHGPNGLTLDNGILILPSIVIINGKHHSTLLIRENGVWRFSRPTPNPGDNENTVYLDNENRIVVDCRTFSTTRRKYYYDFLKDEFIETTPSNIDSFVIVSTEIVNDKGLFYMCFPDSPNNTRKDITLFGSIDGVNWKRICLLYPSAPSSYGYTSIALEDNKLLVCFETPEGIFVQDLSTCRDAIREKILNE